MADDQELWGYPEVAAHLGISVGATRNRKSRGSLPPRTTAPSSTGYEFGPSSASTPWRTNLGLTAPQSSSAFTVWPVPASCPRPPIPLNDG